MVPHEGQDSKMHTLFKDTTASNRSIFGNDTKVEISDWKEQTVLGDGGEIMDWEGGKGKEKRKQRKRQERKGGGSQAVHTAPMGPPGKEEGAPSYTRLSKTTPKKGEGGEELRSG